LTDDLVPTTVPFLYASTYACEVYDDYYPSIALLGPLEDTQFVRVTSNSNGLQSIPWISDMPTNYGAIIKDQVKGDRYIYYEPDSDTTQYLPYGLSVNCFATNSCNFNSTLLGISLTVASDYYIVVWNPDDNCKTEKNHQKLKNGKIFDTFVIQGTQEVMTDTETAIYNYLIQYGFISNHKFLKGPKCDFFPPSP